MECQIILLGTNEIEMYSRGSCSDFYLSDYINCTTTVLLEHMESVSFRLVLRLPNLCVSMKKM